MMKSSLKPAFRDPINLLMLAAAAAAGLMSAWWLFPIGFLLWVIMVILVARDPGTKIREGFEQRPVVAQRFKKTTDRIARSQVKLYNTIQQTSSQHRRAFQPLIAKVNEVTDNAFNLAGRMTIIENHRITSENTAEIKERINAAKMELVLKDDEKVRAEQESIIQSLQSRLDKVAEIEKTLDRAEAQLNSMLTEMENTLTEVVRMQGLDPSRLDQPINELLSVLKREILEAVEYKVQLETD
jgi:uncharacterized protein YhaN